MIIIYLIKNRRKNNSCNKGLIEDRSCVVILMETNVNLLMEETDDAETLLSQPL